MLAVFLIAVVLWVTEAIPCTPPRRSSSAWRSARQRPSDVARPGGFEAPAFATFYYALANPVLMLFLGGFFLADGAAKFKLDRNLARTLLKAVRPALNIILGLMLITAVFSMFMSNTATTAAFMAVVLPVIARLPAGDRAASPSPSASPSPRTSAAWAPRSARRPTPSPSAPCKPRASTSVRHWMVLIVPFMLVTLLAPGCC
jgi:solute carrier family 13 (sodium-dependent dicarboxylate transporter), member 2/3/5